MKYPGDLLLALEMTAADRRYPSLHLDKRAISVCKGTIVILCYGTMFGRVSESTSHGSSNISSTSGLSFCSFTNTVPDEEEETRKWWHFFMPLILFIRGAKKSVQSKVVTMVLPSSRDQLCVVTLSRLIHLCDGLQAAHRHPPVLAFEKPKAPVTRELSVSNW